MLKARKYNWASEKLEPCVSFFNSVKSRREFANGSRINLLTMPQTINHSGWDFESAALIRFYWDQWEFCHLLQLNQSWTLANLACKKCMCIIHYIHSIAFWKSRLLPCEQRGILLDAVAFHLLATFVMVRKLQGPPGPLCIKLQETFLMNLIAKLAKLSGNVLADVSNCA